MLSRSGTHAIRAMVALAKLGPSEYCGVPAIADATGSPRNYLGKLMLQLAREGLLESRTGLGGGFRLAHPADQIHLLDVVATIDDLQRRAECAFHTGACSDARPCIVHERWIQVRESFLSFLRETSIAELAKIQPDIHCPQVDEPAGPACCAVVKRS
jgi:Rrf2 family protein